MSNRRKSKPRLNPGYLGKFAGAGAPVFKEEPGFAGAGAPAFKEEPGPRPSKNSRGLPGPGPGLGPRSIPTAVHAVQDLRYADELDRLYVVKYYVIEGWQS